MPKQTFYHLGIDKQTTLIRAAMKEFSRVPLHEASIANIIKDAGIPRGSFYQYFEDKEDLYFFLLDEESKKYGGNFVSIIKEKNGDIFESFIEHFAFMLKESQNEKQNFYRNVFLNMNHKVENTIAQNMLEKNTESQFLTVISLINTKNLNINNEKELVHIMNIFLAITFQNFIQTFLKKLSMEEALQNFTLQVNLLKRGLIKK